MADLSFGFILMVHSHELEQNAVGAYKRAAVLSFSRLGRVDTPIGMLGRVNVGNVSNTNTDIWPFRSVGAS